MSSNNFEYNSDSEDDYEHITNIIYHPEEISKTKYNIGICELYNKRIHGHAPNEILSNYLLINRYKYLNMGYILDDCDFMNNEYKCLHTYSHYIFPNYRNIVTMQSYIKPEIIECKLIYTGYYIAIIKTFWIKMIQRFWKNIFRNRLNAYKNRKNIYAIQYNERNGKWPNNCYSTGELRGMLSKLKR
jgi:hypothetical protein